MVNISVTVAKVILFVINIFFFIVGIIIMALGIYGLQKSDELEQKGGAIMSDIPLRQGCIVVTAIGVSVIVTSIFGIVGGLLRIRKLLTCYVLFLFIASMMEIGVGIGVLVFGATDDRIDDLIKDKWFSADSGPKITQVQNWLECCGYYNTEDSRTLAPCPNNYTTPCRTAIVDYLNTFAEPIGLFCIIMGCIQLVAMMFACMLWRSKEMEKEFKDRDWQAI